MNDTERRTEIRHRIDNALQRMLDIVERQLDALSPPPPLAAAPAPAVARRQLSNALRLWQFCAQPTCQRARCCRGEPKNCIRIGAPLLPPEMLAGLIAPRKTARRRPRAAISACSLPPCGGGLGRG